MFTPPPKSWSKRQRYIDTSVLQGEELEAAQKENKRIQFENRIACTKKAYFFGYVYPKLMKEYKQYKNIQNQNCRSLFGCKFKDLEAKPDKTPEEKKFIHNFYKYAPLMKNNCIMNVLASYVEDMEFDNRWKKPGGKFDWHILLSGEYEFDDQSLIAKVRNVIRDFNKAQKALALSEVYNAELSPSALEEENISRYGGLFEEYENKLYLCCSNKDKLSDYVVYVYYTYFKSNSKTLIWNVFGEEVVSHVKAKAKTVTFPIRDENGVEYLGQRYSLKEVELDGDV